MGSIRSKIINTLLIVDIGIVLFCYLAGQRDWFINSQIAYSSSLLIVMASIYSYAQMVKTGVENEIVTTSNDELLEKIEDPQGVFDDTSHSEFSSESNSNASSFGSLYETSPAVPNLQSQSSLTLLNGSQVQDDNVQVQDDEENTKISTIEAMKKNKAYISFYRIGAYAILVLGFLYLQNVKIFHMPSYMFGLFLPPVLIAVVFYWNSKTKGVNETN